jgi:uncharacterized protein YebE (UPF0316 family)
MEQLWGSLQMAGLAVMSVGLWTLRVALTARGRKVAGSLTAGLEALVFLLVFSSVMSDMDAIERVAGYAVGVGTGTWLGLFVDGRLSTGQSEVRIVTPERDLTLIRELQGLGWPVTWTPAHGPSGEVTIAFVAVDDTRLARFLRDLKGRASEEFWTVERLTSARAGREHEGWVQIRAGLGLRAGLISGLRRSVQFAAHRHDMAPGRYHVRPSPGDPRRADSPDSQLPGAPRDGAVADKRHLTSV